MPEKEKPKGKQQPDDKKSPDTAEIAFDEIIDAILEADPEAVRGDQIKRQERKRRR